MEKFMPARAKLISMNASLRKPRTQDQFFAWDGHQEGRYEFDGFEPVGSPRTGRETAVQRMPDRRHGLRCEEAAGGPGVPRDGDRYSDQSDAKHQRHINRETYKDGNLVERAWCRIKDFLRIATRDKLARNFASAVALAAVIIWWAD
jgi:transposase